MRLLILIIFLTIYSLLILGCATGPITVVNYELEKLDIYSPLTSAPIKIVDNNKEDDFTFNFGLSKNIKKDATVNVSEPVDSWTRPNTKIFLNIDYNITPYGYFSGGMNFTQINGAELWGGSIGLGFARENDHIGFAVSPSVHLTDISFNAKLKETVKVIEGLETKVISERIIAVKDQKMQYAWSIQMSINSKKKVFGLKGFCAGELTDFHYFKLGYDKEKFRQHATFLTFTPGVYWDINAKQRFLLGIRFKKDRKHNKSSSPEVFLQYDLKPFDRKIIDLH